METPIKDQVTQDNLAAKIDDLNIRLAASEDYKKYGLYIGLAMLVIRIIKR